MESRVDSGVEFLREGRAPEEEIFVVSDEVSGVLFWGEFWWEDKVAAGAIFPCPDDGREEFSGVESDVEKVVAEGWILVDSEGCPERDSGGFSMAVLRRFSALSRARSERVSARSISGRMTAKMSCISLGCEGR